MKAAIIIDNWKLPIFDRHLKQSGYSYESTPNLTKNTMVISVQTENQRALGIVVKAANTEAAHTGPSE